MHEDIDNYNCSAYSSAVGGEVGELVEILESASSEVRREVVDFAAFVTERRGKKHVRIPG